MESLLLVALGFGVGYAYRAFQQLKRLQPPPSRLPADSTGPIVTMPKRSARIKPSAAWANTRPKPQPLIRQQTGLYNQEQWLDDEPQRRDRGRTIDLGS